MKPCRSRCVTVALAVVLALLSLWGCREEKGAEELLWSLVAEAERLPDGEIYLSSAEEGDVGYLSDALVERMYGEAAESLLDVSREIALFLPSFSQPAELVAVRCDSVTDAHRAEEILRERRDFLAVAFVGTEWESLARSAAVTREGRYVFFLMAENAEELALVAKRIC